MIAISRVRLKVAKLGLIFATCFSTPVLAGDDPFYLSLDVSPRLGITLVSDPNANLAKNCVLVNDVHPRSSFFGKIVAGDCIVRVGGANDG